MGHPTPLLRRALWEASITAAVFVMLDCGQSSSTQSNNQSNDGGQRTSNSTEGGPSGPSSTGGPTADASTDASVGASVGSVDSGASTGGPHPDASTNGGTSADGSPNGSTSGSLDFTNVDVANNTKRRLGAPLVAVNPTNTDNVVVLAGMNLGYTRSCLPPPPGSDCELIGTFNQPRGFYKTPGFADIGVYVSSDHGKTFKTIDVTQLVPPDHPEITSKGEGPIAVTADGTFYIGFNAINWGQWESASPTFFPNGGVGVIKSTDGGMTWTWQSLTQTPADWPYGTSDISNGTFYVTSGLGGASTLGARSTGDPNSPDGTIADRWTASTKDGTTWTPPEPLGGDDATGHVSASHSPISAARGVMATLFTGSDQSSCSFFVGAAATTSCVVFQTSNDAGVTWNRHAVPVPANFSPYPTTGLLLAADPSMDRHFTVALLDDAASQFFVYQTPDAGNTWTGPIQVSEDPGKTHWAPAIAYAPTGELGLMWRTYEADPSNPGASAPYMPYSVWAVTSKDGGATFSMPLKVTKANSPAPPDDPNDAFSFIGDHGPSGMSLDGHGYAYVVWADWTPGERTIMFSAINLKAFK